MYRRDARLGPWTDIYAMGACIYACMTGPPSDVLQRQKKDRLPMALGRLRGVFRQPDGGGALVHGHGPAGPAAVGVCAAQGAEPQASRRYTPCRWPRKCGCSWKRC
jgi:hypothetical protein